MLTHVLWKCFILVLLSLFEHFICWFGSLSLKNERMDNIVRMCSKISGIQWDELSLLYRTRGTGKAQAILADCIHRLSAEFKLLPSGHRFALPRCRKNRFKNNLYLPPLVYLTALCDMSLCDSLCVRIFNWQHCWLYNKLHLRDNKVTNTSFMSLVVGGVNFRKGKKRRDL